MAMINKTFSSGYIKEKLDENDQRVDSIIKRYHDKLDKNDIALLRGNKLHNMPVLKELGILEDHEYNKRYSAWMDEMKEYHFGTTPKKWIVIGDGWEEYATGTVLDEQGIEDLKDYLRFEYDYNKESDFEIMWGELKEII